MNKHTFDGIYEFLNSKYTILYLLCKTFLYDCEVDKYKDEYIKSNSLAYKYWFAENVIDCYIYVNNGYGAYIGYIDAFGELRQLFISDIAFKWITFAKFRKTEWDDENFTYSKLKHLRKNCVVVNDIFTPTETLPFILSENMQEYLIQQRESAIARQLERELKLLEIHQKAMEKEEREKQNEKEFTEFSVDTKNILQKIRNYDN